MTKKFLFLIFICVIIVFLLNFEMPRIGEDFALSIPYSTSKISLMEKISDIFTKIFQHSLGWNARLGEQLAILFLSFDKTFFNLINIFITIVYCFLVLTYAKGDFPKTDFETSYIFFVTFMMFFLLPKSGDLFLWASVATNYLWGSFLLILFFLPYRIWLSGRNFFLHKSKIYYGIFICLGILAGMTNENTVLAIVGMILISYFLHRIKAIDTISPPNWFWIGLPFLLIGYFYLLLSPSTKMRRDYYLQAYGISQQGISDYILKAPELIIQYFSNSKNLLFVFLLFALLLFYINRKGKQDLHNKNNIRISIFLFLISFSSVAVLIFAPYFESRTLLLNWFFLFAIIANFMYEFYPLKKLIILSTIPVLLFGLLNLSKLSICTFNLSIEAQNRKVNIIEQTKNGLSEIIIDRYSTSCPDYFSDREDWLISFLHDEIYYGVNKIIIVSP